MEISGRRTKPSTNPFDEDFKLQREDVLGAGAGAGAGAGGHTGLHRSPGGASPSDLVSVPFTSALRQLSQAIDPSLIWFV